MKDAYETVTGFCGMCKDDVPDDVRYEYQGVDAMREHLTVWHKCSKQEAEIEAFDWADVILKENNENRLLNSYKDRYKFPEDYR